MLKGPFGQFILSGDTALKFKLDYETALRITKELWKANIWDFEQVNMVYGFYKVIPGESWSSVITSRTQLQGILTARHSNVKKELAKNKGYKVPNAMVIELAKLTQGMSFSDDMKGYEAYFKNILEFDERAEGVEEPEIVVIGEMQEMLLRYGYEVLLVVNGLEVGVIGKKEIGRGYIEGVIRVGESGSDSESVDMGIREREGGREGYESRGKYVGGEVGGRIEKGRMRIEIGVKEYGGNKQGVEGMFRLGYAI